MCCSKATSPLTFAMRLAPNGAFSRMLPMTLDKVGNSMNINQSWNKVGEKSSNLAIMVGVVWYCFHARNLSCVVTLRIVRHMDGHIGLRQWGKLGHI